jgi:UDP-glucose 4-epimerase
MIQTLEADPSIDTLVGLGTGRPMMPFERAEFVRADQAYTILHRIVEATQVDTILHTFLVVDSTSVRPGALHEINVIGTMNLLAAAGAAGSSVGQLVVKSSTLVYGSSEKDPSTFEEDTPRATAARTGVERSLLEAESLVRDFAEDHPTVPVAVLRCANVLGPEIVTPISKNLSRSFTPVIFGFDPLVQFVEEVDVIAAIEHLRRRRLSGTFNLAGAGRLPWSEVAAICGARLLPLSPWRPAWTIAPLIRLGVYELPAELEALLRYGRGVDTRRLAATGFEPAVTSAGAVEVFIRALRRRRSVGRQPASYIYEHDVEQFFRQSPSVVRPLAD